jgi:transglutaminase-like putative cysteine protease
MRRHLSSTLSITVEEQADIVFSVAVARREQGVTDALSVTLDGKAISATVVDDEHGTVLHRVRSAPGALLVKYTADVTGRDTPAPVDEHELIRYLRPSRYPESDALAPTAAAEFSGLEGLPLLEAVSSWVGTTLEYVSGSSLPTDGAVRTLLSRTGVCRDFAHLCIGLLRARGVPARLVSVYAPGLDPMDFHAVCEAFVDGRWLVVDATTLAPRSSLVRIATGRDAADTAFMTIISGTAQLESVEVTAVVDELPNDHLDDAVQLG